MKITLLVVGKTSADYLEKGIAEYEKRIKRYINFEIKVIKNIKNTKNMPSRIIKENEGKLISALIKKDDYLIVLDEKGQMFNSIEFSKNIQNKLNTGVKNLVFLIGGAYGFSQQVYLRTNEKLSLSKMTFSHQPIRLLFIEQLYRAFTIIKGEPYHNE